MVANAELIDELRLSWSRLLPYHPMLGEGVLSRLSRPGGSFHRLAHLKRCLDGLEMLGCAERAEYLALWYHNVASSGSHGHHDQASAAVAATELLGAGLPWREVGYVARLVLVTAGHQPGPDRPGSDRINDADLCGLASSFEQVEAGFRESRAEMPGPTEEDRTKWQRGWIEGMLARERIFHTERGHELWEVQAHANLEAMLAVPAFA